MKNYKNVDIFGCILDVPWSCSNKENLEYLCVIKANVPAEIVRNKDSPIQQRLRGLPPNFLY